MWLVFEKDYDKMKHVNCNLYQNTNTVIPFELNLYQHNQEYFIFLFQMDYFSAREGVELVSQRQVLFEEESSPCLPFRWAEWGFMLNLPSPSRQTLLVKREYQCPVWKQRLHPADRFPSRIQHRPDQQTPATFLCPYLVRLHLRVHRPSFHVFLAG